MLYLGRESGMNMEEENPIIQFSPRYGSYFTLKFAFRAVFIPGGFEELQSVTIKFLQRKQQAMYVCLSRDTRQSTDAFPFFFSFFFLLFSLYVSCCFSIIYLLTCKLHYLYAILPDSAVLSTLYLQCRV